MFGNVESEMPMVWAFAWLLGEDVGRSYLAGRTVMSVNWPNACKVQGLSRSKCSTNGSPYYYCEFAYP